MGADERSILFSLLRSVLHGKLLNDAEKQSITSDLLTAAMKIAKRHDIVHLVALGAMNNNVLEDAQKPQMQQTTYYAAYRYEKLNYDFCQMCKVLEKAKIPFIPLKGAVIRQYYPEPWMRTSGDVDILVRKEMLEAAVRLLVEELGYQESGSGDHDVLLRTPSGVLLELHYDTISERYANDAVRNVLAQIWDDAKPTAPGSYHYQITDPMFYFYHIAHMAKHFQVGGCGVRSFLDVWVLNHRVDFDKEARRTILQKGGLLKFAQAAEELSEAWFSGEQMDEMSMRLQEYILRAGLYGGNENRAALGQVKNGGKVRYVLFQRVFLPYAYLKAEYPVLEKKRWLLPVYQVVRWYKALKRKETFRRVAELKANAKVSSKDTDDVAKLLEFLGL